MRLACAERKTDGDFAPSRDALGNHETRDVGAAHYEQQPDDRREQKQRVPFFSFRAGIPSGAVLQLNARAGELLGETRCKLWRLVARGRDPSREVLLPQNLKVAL